MSQGASRHTDGSPPFTTTRRSQGRGERDSEIRELRHMVRKRGRSIQQLREENERLRDAMKDARFALDQGRPQDAAQTLRDALEEGGDAA